jgi:hypothetical protein
MPWMSHLTVGESVNERTLFSECGRLKVAQTHYKELQTSGTLSLAR